jgi:hypothetical protein
MPLPKGSYYDATTGEEKIAETNNGNWFCVPCWMPGTAWQVPFEYSLAAR